MLAALSVFQGGWTLELAERVCEADVELLESLVDESLVRRIGSGRLFMLETIREFAGEHLDPERRDELMSRLLDVLADTFEGANLRPESPGRPAMELAQEERPNVDVALDWAIQAGEPAAGLQLLWMLEMYWATNDPFEGRRRVSALLEEAGDDVDPAAYARALRFRGATYDFTHGSAALAEQEYERAIEAFQALGDEVEAVHLRHRIAFCAEHQGDLGRAKRLASEALELDRRTGNRRDEALALNVLGTVAFREGDRESGLRLSLESASIAESLGFTWFRGVTLLGASEWLIAANEPEAAVPVFRDGLETLLSVQDRVNLAIALAAGAAISAGRGDAELAGKLWGAVEFVSEREPRPTTTQNLRHYSPYVEPVHGAAFDRGHAVGRTLSLEEAVRYALSVLD